MDDSVGVTLAHLPARQFAGASRCLHTPVASPPQHLSGRSPAHRAPLSARHRNRSARRWWRPFSSPDVRI